MDVLLLAQRQVHHQRVQGCFAVIILGHHIGALAAHVQVVAAVAMAVVRHLGIRCRHGCGGTGLEPAVGLYSRGGRGVAGYSLEVLGIAMVDDTCHGNALVYAYPDVVQPVVAAVLGTGGRVDYVPEGYVLAVQLRAVGRQFQFVILHVRAAAVVESCQRGERALVRQVGHQTHQQLVLALSLCQVEAQLHWAGWRWRDRKFRKGEDAAAAQEHAVAAVRAVVVALIQLHLRAVHHVHVGIYEYHTLGFHFCLGSGSVCGNRLLEITLVRQRADGAAFREGCVIGSVRIYCIQIMVFGNQVAASSRVQRTGLRRLSSYSLRGPAQKRLAVRGCYWQCHCCAVQITRLAYPTAFVEIYRVRHRHGLKLRGLAPSRIVTVAVAIDTLNLPFVSGSHVQTSK